MDSNSHTPAKFSAPNTTVCTDSAQKSRMLSREPWSPNPLPSDCRHPFSAGPSVCTVKYPPGCRRLVRPLRKQTASGGRFRLRCFGETGFLCRVTAAIQSNPFPALRILRTKEDAKNKQCK
uniref:(northern house mosquito) hypothetical protein n=1 Tax=Culex pipiens TaxID=7175 RepID=A0A8D8CCA3_CULPI